MQGIEKGDKNDDSDERFYIVITDLKTRRLISVSRSRKKQALDGFFEIIGSEASRGNVVVNLDQHEGNAASVRQ